jgi:DNA (cytosine-5)-methyltransferase 1
MTAGAKISEVSSARLSEADEHLMSTTKRHPKVISLYSGAGGLDYGFEAAGFETVFANDLDHDSCETLRLNRQWSVVERSVFEVPSEEILSVAGVAPGEVDILIGGPPCQPFSKSGYWAKGESARLDDPRAATLDAYLRVVEDLQPRTFLLENVHGIAYSDKNEGLQLLLRKIREINRRTGSRYIPRYEVLNAAWYGVPQLRERFFLIASRDGTIFNFPSPAYTDPSEHRRLRELPSYRTAWDALADVRNDPSEDTGPRGKWAELLPSIPEGHNYLWHTERGGGLPLFGWRRRYWNFLLKLSKSLPSWTIQAQPGPAVGPFHWENRRLSHRELCRIQTFPDGVHVAGGRRSIQRQIGNAVPSLLAEVLGREIKTQLLGYAKVEGPLRLLPPDRSPAPPPHSVLPVPSTYQKLAGRHRAHPGTGKGPRSTQQHDELFV